MRASDPSLCNLCIDLHRSNQIPTLTANRSRAATPSIIALDRVGCPRAPHPQRSNPHRARCTTASYFPRFRPLEGFVRRPLVCGAASVAAGIRNPSQEETFRGSARRTAKEATDPADRHLPFRVGCNAFLESVLANANQPFEMSGLHHAPWRRGLGVNRLAANRYMIERSAAGEVTQR
jgi:hypothetical protein